jgi:hypothetical protein
MIDVRHCARPSDSLEKETIGKKGWTNDRVADLHTVCLPLMDALATRHLNL